MQDIHCTFYGNYVVLSPQRHGGFVPSRPVHGLANSPQLTDKDMVNYAYTIRDKVGENILVMKQIENNSPEQALLGDFSKAIDDATLDSSEAHQNQMMQLLADPSKAANFARIVFDLLVQGQARTP